MAHASKTPGVARCPSRLNASGMLLHQRRMDLAAVRIEFAKELLGPLTNVCGARRRGPVQMRGGFFWLTHSACYFATTMPVEETRAAPTPPIGHLEIAGGAGRSQARRTTECADIWVRAMVSGQRGTVMRPPSQLCHASSLSASYRVESDFSRSRLSGAISKNRFGASPATR